MRKRVFNFMDLMVENRLTEMCLGIVIICLLTICVSSISIDTFTLRLARLHSFFFINMKRLMPNVLINFTFLDCKVHEKIFAQPEPPESTIIEATTQLILSAVTIEILAMKCVIAKFAQKMMIKHRNFVIRLNTRNINCSLPNYKNY